VTVMTIHALDPEVERRVRQKAEDEHKSLNQTLKELLAESVGVSRKRADVNRARFERFCGVWSEQEADEFDAAVADLQRVDPRDWE